MNKRDYFSLDFGPFYLIAWESGLWFRLFGYGPHLQIDRPVYFSERYGYTRVWRLGRVSFRWLTPNPL